MVEKIKLSAMNDQELLNLSTDRLLSLNTEEMQAVRNYFKQEMREPSDLEMEVIAQTWSEHCKHKIFNSQIEITENRKTRVYKNLFKETIVKSTKKIKKKLGKKDYTVSIFKDNSGIIKFNKRYNICFKVETHNHPSALDPFGGANTGIGGVIRDILGTGLCATPIANTDIFCFAKPGFEYKKLPEGILHPKRIYKGVVAGIKDYGNKIGIPTVNGSIHFDDRYLGNPIVYAGTLGIIPCRKSFKNQQKNDLIVTVGGRTGKDGIHGATFSSIELDDKSEDTSSSAVQIGDPITEKKFMDVLIKARDMDLFNSITDCGAGGFSSAVGEMAEGFGAEVFLEKAPLKHKNMKAWEIFLSESQERMVLAVPEKNLKKLINMFKEENVEATVIGRFTNTNRLKVYYNKMLCSDLNLDFLHTKVPVKKFKINYKNPVIINQKFKPEKNLTTDLLKLLSTGEISSKEHVIREYDFEVKAGTYLKPLQGPAQGPGNGSVVIPDFHDKKNGIAVAHGINIRYGDIDPYWMALSAIDEAIRNYLSIGGDLSKAALLDNFCWGNPNQDEKLGALVKAAQACYDAAVNFNLPFISGKDSFYNEFIYKKNKTISIPYTLLISIFGPIKINNIISMDFKKPVNSIFILGETNAELGASCFYQLHNIKNKNVPHVNLKKAKKLFKHLEKAIDKKFIISCHDISDGGMITALAEMSLAGGMGFCGDIENIPISKKIKHAYEIFFSESNSRFLVEVDKNKAGEFKTFFKNFKTGCIGKITNNNKFQIFHKKKLIINTNVEMLDKHWRRL